MASLGDLVVKIGADTRDLNKQLGKVQREFRSMTSNITQLGQNLTRNITLPLAALGAAAVKSAADLETLETSFISLTGGAKEARDMVADLNKFTAETPFQLEAVGKAARQLIAAGTGIDEVNNQLQFLGDIAATSGSSIDEIAAIFAKVQAKGKVELENLNQLAERGIPIFTALSEATGLLPSELGAGAVSVEQFNDTLRSFAQEGGFAEGAMQRLSQTAAGRFSTALDNLKQAGAELGNVMLPTINKLLGLVTDLAQRFTAMDDSVKQAVVRLGLVASTIGPGLLFLPQVIKQVRLLSAALAANPILAAAGIITAIGIALSDMEVNAKKATTSIEELRNQFGDLTKTSREQKRKETAETIDLLFAYKELQEGIKEAQDQATEGLGAGSFPAINASIAATKKYIASLSDAERAILDQGDALLDINRKNVAYATQTEAATDAIFEQQNRLAALTVQVVSNADAVDTATTKTRVYADEMQRLEVNTVATEQAAKTLQETTWNVGEMINNTTGQVDQMGVAMVNAFSNAAASAQSFAGFAIEAIKGVLIAYLAEAKARVIANSAEASAGTGPAYPFVMAGMIGAGMALINKIPIPALAEGGLASGPTMAIVGDNRNAAIDPEVISPLSKLKDMMGGSQVEVFGRISGNDIFLSNSRSGFKRNRYS
jgi:tape measure domain-containing protein